MNSAIVLCTFFLNHGHRVMRADRRLVHFGPYCRLINRRWLGGKPGIDRKVALVTGGKVTPAVRELASADLVLWPAIRRHRARVADLLRENISRPARSGGTLATHCAGSHTIRCPDLLVNDIGGTKLAKASL